MKLEARVSAQWTYSDESFDLRPLGLAEALLIGPTELLPS
jgi:hypothetical protein